ncbi:MAG: histidine phosphatase family protein [Leptospira sp.]|nr:histidine phosphatase family protein [Leptospira sp.]
MPTLYFIRHAQANRSGENYDQLSDLGQRQSKLLGEYFARQEIIPDFVYRGSLVRHRDTAKISLDACTNKSTVNNIIEDQDLNEFSPELWAANAEKIAESDSNFRKTLEHYRTIRSSGSHRANALFIILTEKVMDYWMNGNHEIEGIESMEHFRGRILRSLNTRISEHRGDSVIFIYTSGTPISVLLSEFLGWKKEMSLEWMRWILNTSVTIVRQDKKGFFPISINTTPHLQEKEMRTLL